MKHPSDDSSCYEEELQRGTGVNMYERTDGRTWREGAVQDGIINAFFWFMKIHADKVEQLLHHNVQKRVCVYFI